jgi:hypothetical protein
MPAGTSGITGGQAIGAYVGGWLGIMNRAVLTFQGAHDHFATAHSNGVRCRVSRPSRNG